MTPSPITEKPKFTGQFKLSPLACMPGDTTPSEWLTDWPEMPLKAYNHFKMWTGIKFALGTRLVRNKGDHIFAINPISLDALCVYRHERTFGE